MTRLKLLLIFIASTIYAVAHEDVAQYKLEVMDFSELKVTDAINVTYHCSEDSAGWAYFECSPDVAQRLIFTNNKSQLHIQVDMMEFHGQLPTIHVFSRNLTKVDNTADSTIYVERTVPVQSFKARVVGNGAIIIRYIEAGSIDAGINTGRGHIVINGEATKVKLANVGTGTVEAGGLGGQNVKVIVTGTGSVDCKATEALSIYGAGSGTVYYTGEPEKITNRSLGVKAVAIGSN